MSRFKTLIGNITQDPNGPSETIIKKDASEEMKGSFIAGLLSSMSDAERNDFFEFTAKRTNMSVEELKSKLVNELNDKLDLNMPSDVFDMDMGEGKTESENPFTSTGVQNNDYDGHFDPAVFGDSDRKDFYVYDQVTRDVVAKNYMEELAKENGMSVEDIEKILNEPAVENDELGKNGPIAEKLVAMNPIIGDIIGKDETNKAQSIRDKYNEYMQGYDEYVEYVNSLKATDRNVHNVFIDASISAGRQDMRATYRDVMDKAHQEIDTYIEAREAISGLKDRMSPEAYAKLESGLIESNPVIAKSIGEYFPDCSEGKFANPDKESGLSGIDSVTPHEPIVTGPVEPEKPIVPSFPWDKPKPQPMPYYPHLDGGDGIITGEPDYINPDGTNPGQMINYDDKSNEGSSSLKNALGKVTDKVAEFGQKITSSFDKVVDNNKTSRGHEFDDIVAESANDIQLDK